MSNSTHTKIPNIICLRRRQLCCWDIEVEEIHSIYSSWILGQWRYNYVAWYFDYFLIHFCLLAMTLCLELLSEQLRKRFHFLPLVSQVQTVNTSTQFITFVKYAFSICGISILHSPKLDCVNTFFFMSYNNWMLNPALSSLSSQGYLGTHV